MSLTTQKTAEIIRQPSVLATPLLVLLIDTWGTEFFEWDPQTIHLELKSTFGDGIPKQNEDKIQALLVALTTNSFWNSFEAWMHITNTLNNSETDFAQYDPPTVQDICWALSEIHLVDPPEKGDEFNDEIKTYLTQILKAEGYTRAPKLLKPFIKNLDNEENIDNVLTADEIDSKGYFEDQERKLLAIDSYVADRLLRLIQQVVELPLLHSDAAALRDLKSRAEKALVRQAGQVRREQGSAPPQPFQ